jgi:Flp pilus assembly protein TadB
MTPAALAALATAALTAGLLLIITGLVGTRRPARPPARLVAALRRLGGQALTPGRRRTRQTVAVAAAAGTAAVWLYTKIPVAGLLAGLAVVGVPWLFGSGRAEQRAIARLEGLGEWTRRLDALVRTGLGLNQAIIVSTRDAPAAIADELGELAAQLRAGTPPAVALSRFADLLADASSDEVIAPLALHATDRGRRLADVLDRLGDNIAREVSMRREVWAARADPRLTTRFMTVLSVVVVAALFTSTTYTSPYRTVLGQTVLAASAATFIGLLVWIRRLSQPRRVPRLLAGWGRESP